MRSHGEVTQCRRWGGLLLLRHEQICFFTAQPKLRGESESREGFPSSTPTILMPGNDVILKTPGSPSLGMGRGQRVEEGDMANKGLEGR